MRIRTWSALRGIYKPAHTLELIGCSIDFLRSHLESLFKEGMSWSNYGEWEIDHIIPLASFDFQNHPETQFIAFNYKNTQPLWKSENRSKGAKICV